MNKYCNKLGYTTSKGKHIPTGTVYSFLKDIVHLLEMYGEAEEWYVAWDTKPTVRKKIDASYKANRKKNKDESFYHNYIRMQIQLNELRRFLPCVGIIQCKAVGHEADDVLATLAYGGEAVLITNDKDLFQSITREVTMYNFQEEKSYDWFKKEYGIEPQQWIDVQSLVGDATDNIPGMKGVGVKTAIKMLNRYGSLGGILKSEDKWIVDSRSIIQNAQALVTLKNDLDIEIVKPQINVLAFRRFLIMKRLKTILKKESVFRSILMEK